MNCLCRFSLFVIERSHDTAEQELVAVTDSQEKQVCILSSRSFYPIFLHKAAITAIHASSKISLTFLTCYSEGPHLIRPQQRDLWRSVKNRWVETLMLQPKAL